VRRDKSGFVARAGPLVERALGAALARAHFDRAVTVRGLRRSERDLLRRFGGDIADDDPLPVAQLVERSRAARAAAPE